MNPKTLQLISCLRENSREKLTTISKKTQIPISTLFDTLKELQGTLITKNTILLDFSKFGFDARAQVLLKVNQENKDKLKKHLQCHPNVNNVYKINNGWNFIVEVVYKNIKEIDVFLELLEKKYGLVDKQIHYLIDDVKREGFSLTIQDVKCCSKMKKGKLVSRNV